MRRTPAVWTGVFYLFAHIAAGDVIQLMVSSPTQVADYEIALRHDASNNCVVWGHVVRS